MVAKPVETKAPVVSAPAPAAAFAPVPSIAAPVPAAAVPVPSAGGAAPAVSVEEKLRLFALQSMMKKQVLPKPAATTTTTGTATGIGGAAVPTVFGSTPTKQPPNASPTRGATPTKAVPVAASSEEEALKVRGSSVLSDRC